MSSTSYCPECDEEFGSERSMRIHYGHSHNGNLPNNTCSSCSKDFYHPSRNDRVYCDECFQKLKGPKEKPNSVSIPEDKEWESMSSYQRFYYKNREKEISRKSPNGHRDKLRKFVNRIKSYMSCSKCDEKRIACLVFHHKDDKEENISDMVRKGVAMGKLKREIKKCIILCANCHRLVHRKT
jgi:uncharacterized protein YeeX (DUF496 family)